MPRFDTTGPAGAGPLTGRGLGPCGVGMGWRGRSGFGQGIGRFNCWNCPFISNNPKKALKEYKKALEEELDKVNKELEEVDKEG